MQILPGYILCLDHRPVAYVQSYIHWVSFYLLKPYILFSSLLTSDIRIKSEFHHLLYLHRKFGKFSHSCSHPIVFDYSQVICMFLFWIEIVLFFKCSGRMSVYISFPCDNLKRLRVTLWSLSLFIILLCQSCLNWSHSLLNIILVSIL